MDAPNDVGIFSSVVAKRKSFFAPFALSLCLHPIASVAGTGLPAIAYIKLGKDGQSELRLLQCSSADCSANNIRLIASGISMGYNPSLAAGPDGLLFLSCSQPGVGAFVFICHDLECANHTMTAIMPDGGTDSGWTSAAVVAGQKTVSFSANLGERSIVAYWRQGSPTQIIYTKPGTFQFQWGSDRNMAVQSPTGNAFVATYADGTGLILLVCSNAPCRPDLVQDREIDRTASLGQDVGLYPSLIVHPVSGLAIMASHDATNLALRMAFCLDRQCNTWVKKMFPSTFGWDPAVALHSTTQLPFVIYSNPASNAIVAMACADNRCENATFATVYTEMPRRFETVRRVASSGLIVAHDTSSNSMYAVRVPGSISTCLENCLQIVLTSPMSSPFATADRQITVTGYLLPTLLPPGTAIQATNNDVNTTLTLDAGNFTGSIQLAPGTNFIILTATNASGVELGSASLIIVQSSGQPKLEITNPGSNGTSVGVQQIFVEGTASAVTGIQSVTVTNLATQLTWVTSTTSPTWSAFVNLTTNTRNVLSVTAVDGLGNSVTREVFVFQTGLAPKITCPMSLPAVECGTPIPNAAVRIINCAESVVSLPETSVPSCQGTTKTLTRPFSACSRSCNYTITIVDTTNPTIVCPPDTSIACNDPTPRPGASDSCTTALVNPVMSPDRFQCGAANQLVTFSVADGCGNTASCNFRLSVAAATNEALPTTTSTSTPTNSTSPISGGVSGGSLIGLIIGLVILFLLLLLVILLALWWLRRRKRNLDESGTAMPILMDTFDDDMSSSVSSVTRSKLYKKPSNQSSESQDFADIF